MSQLFKDFFSKFSFRRIPHPGYGNYGGAKKRCESEKSCPMPVDTLDLKYQYHDLRLKSGDQFADVKLVRDLLMVNPFGDYEEPVYGRAYHAGSLLLFAGISLVTTPLGLVRKVVKV